MPDDIQNKSLEESRKAYEEEVMLATAEDQLRRHRGYDWLLVSKDKQIWSVSEIVAELDKVGMKVSNDTVIRWIKPLEQTQNFGGAVGLRATRTDLIIFFAEALHKQIPKGPASRKRQESEIPNLRSAQSLELGELQLEKSSEGIKK
jgi:hypothetical protein